ncbi:mechanosensitive ion channel family protein [Gammaproteobacteria bacterium]|nr:mechanosensitive ion channel family protein [Gammaproteobacteria bacterium]
MQNATIAVFTGFRPRIHGTFLYLLLCATLVLFPPYPVWAQSEAQNEPENISIKELNIEDAKDWESEDLGQLQVAPVVVNGKVLFHVVGVASFPADRRAERIVKIIEALAEDKIYNPDALYIVEADGYHRIYRDKTSGDKAEIDTTVVTIHDEDAALEGLGRDIIAVTFRGKIISSIESYRRDRSPNVMMTKALHAFGRTLALIAILYGVIWGFRRLHGIVERRFKSKIEKLEAKSMRILQAEQIWNVVSGVLRLLRVAIILVLVYFFINFVLSLFPWTRYIAQQLMHLVIDPLGGMLDAVLGYFPSLIFLILLFLITRYVLKLARAFFLAIARGNMQFSGFDADWAIPTYRIVRVVIVAFAVVLAYPYIPGSDSDAFKGITILLGVLFSLGSSSMISNIIAGFTMTYRRAFRIGDRVKIGDTLGDVTDMRVLVTHVRSLKNEEVVIPNSTILNNEVINYSTMAKKEGLILHTTVGIGYEVPWRQVEAMLLMAADRSEGLLKEPKPFVLQKALADYAVNYELNVYCNNEKQALPLYSALHRNIQDVFNEYGIQIMTPSYRSDTPDPKIVPKDQWYAEPAAPAETKQG